jgi:hypothetical protein
MLKDIGVKKLSTESNINSSTLCVFGVARRVVRRRVGCRSTRRFDRATPQSNPIAHERVGSSLGVWPRMTSTLTFKVICTRPVKCRYYSGQNTSNPTRIRS